MKNLIRGHIYQLKKRPFLFRMPCTQLYPAFCIDPAFFLSGIGIRLCYGDRAAA